MLATDPSREAVLQLMPGHVAPWLATPCVTFLASAHALVCTPHLPPRYIELLGSVANHQAALFALVMGR